MFNLLEKKLKTELEGDNLVFLFENNCIATYLYKEQTLSFLECKLTLEQIDSIRNLVKEYTECKKEINYYQNKIELLLDAKLES